MTRIVVGIDGSAAARAALAHAVDDARRRDAELEVVHAWVYPALTVLPMAPTMPVPADLDAAARELVADELAEVGATDLATRITVVQGQPAAALIDAAKGADLLVVGSRGLGGIAKTLLGSVSSACAHHAPCPVTIVPEPE